MSRRVNSVAFGLERAARVGNFVGNRVGLQLEPGLRFSTLRRGQMALGIACPAVVQHPIELQPNGPRITVAGEAGVIERLHVTERRERR